MVGHEMRLLMSEVAPFGLPRGRVRLQWLVLAEWLGWFHEAIEGVSGELDQIGLATWCGLDGPLHKNEAEMEINKADLHSDRQSDAPYTQNRSHGSKHRIKGS
jgi:hypothetical protein